MKNKISKQKNTSNEILFAIPQEDLADLVVNFLGKKETLEYNRNESFLLKYEDISQFYYLLEDKINKEQYTSINHFNISIQYSDSTTRNIDSISSYESFTETRPVTVVGLTLSWNIILKFPNAKNIENQKIELSFLLDKNQPEGYVDLTINHTNQAWSIEVLSLFRNHLDNLLIKTPKPVEWLGKIKRTSSEIIQIITVILFLPLVFSLNFGSEIDTFDKVKRESILEVLEYENKSLISISERDYSINIIKIIPPEDILNLLSSSKSSGNIYVKNILKEYSEIQMGKISRINFILWLFATISICIAIILIYAKHFLSYYEQKSFILITRKTENEYFWYLEKKGKLQHYSFSLITFSIICSVSANFIYQVIPK